MPLLDSLGPALIGALVVMMGWVVSERRDRNYDGRRRSERIRDYKIALRAEISCHLPRWTMFDPEAHLEDMDKRIRTGARRRPPFTPFVPKESDNAVFDAVATEIQILPGDVIEPVIRYYQQVSVISQLAEDMRGPAYAALEADRKFEIYSDYIDLIIQAGQFAQIAIEALETSQNDE